MTSEQRARLEKARDAWPNGDLDAAIADADRLEKLEAAARAYLAVSGHDETNPCWPEFQKAEADLAALLGEKARGA